MQKDLTTWLPVLLLVVLGVLAGTGNMLQSGIGTDDGFPDVIDVTSAADRGPGSLREALFMAMKAPHAVTIRLAVDVIDIEVPLPPIAAHGTTIAGDTDAPVTLRFATESSATGGLLEIAANGVSVRDIAVDAAGGPAIVVRGDNASLDSIAVSNSSVAIDGFDTSGLTISSSEFAGNEIGVRLSGRRATATISGNLFREHGDSGIWMALATEDADTDSNVRVHDNRFAGGRDGIVAVNIRMDLRGNRLSGFTRTGISLQDSRASVVGNQVLDSNGIGIHVLRLRNSSVIDNEVARNQQIGILVVDAHGLQVERNHVYQNGYGIAAVGLQPIDASVRQNTLSSQMIDGLIAIGDSPFIGDNRSVENGRAGIRILNLVRPGLPTITAEPRLANNTLSGNGEDDVQFGDYVVRSP